MFEFSGSISKNAERKFLKRLALQNLLITSVVTVIVLSITLFCLAVAKIFETWMIVPFSVGVLWIITIGALSPYIEKKRFMKTMEPKRFTVNDDGEAIIELEFTVINQLVCNVDKLIDYGDYYYIMFVSPRGQKFILEKELIRKGTIKNFEEFFGSKLKRR